MIEALGTLIIVIPIIVLLGLLAFLAQRKKERERHAHSYHEIATKWSLWDEFVNCYHEGARELSNPNDVARKVKRILENAKEMDYETFHKHSTDEKLRMLNAAFGEETPK